LGLSVIQYLVHCCTNYVVCSLWLRVRSCFFAWWSNEVCGWTRKKTFQQKDILEMDVLCIM